MTRVYFSPRADRSITRIEAWWREYRQASPALFASELRTAVRLLETARMLGTVYEPYTHRGVRRLVLERTRYHVYFRETLGGEVEIIQVWSAVRGRGPTL